MLSAGLLTAVLFLAGCGNPNENSLDLNGSDGKNIGETTPAKTLVKIEITAEPTKTEYYLNESINLGGLEVKATYSDSTVAVIVTSELEITGFDTSTAGEKTITITYDGKSDTFAVKVENINLTKIEITQGPTKTEYYLKESLNLDGLVVTATLSNGTTEILDVDELEITGFDSAAAGEKTVTVSSAGKTAAFTVTVLNITLIRIEITAGPIKTSYWLFEHLDLDGLVLTATLSNGKTEILDVDELGITGFDLNNAGTQTITVSSAGKTAAFSVTVTARIFTVTFNKNGGDSEASPNTKTVTQPATAIDKLPTPPTKTGFDFIGWKDENGNSFTAESPVIGNITVNAQWQQSQPVYQIGGTGPGGGKIFYYSEEGFTLTGFGATKYHYLEASPNDLGNAQWGASGDDIEDETGHSTGDEIGDGKFNTQILVAFLNSEGEKDRAAQLCANYTNNGLKDWFLPSANELDTLFENRAAAGITLQLGSTYYYWSSSEADDDFRAQKAWAVYYSTSNNRVYGTDRNRSTTNIVRAIRAF